MRQQRGKRRGQVQGVCLSMTDVFKNRDVGDGSRRAPLCSGGGGGRRRMDVATAATAACVLGGGRVRETGDGGMVRGLGFRFGFR
jgi:hypothetical protein